MSRHLVLDCPVNGFDCALDLQEGVAGQSFRSGLLEALDERAAADDELLTQVSQLLDFSHDPFSNWFGRYINQAGTLKTTGALLTHRFSAGNLDGYQILSERKSATWRTKRCGYWYCEP